VTCEITGITEDHHDGPVVVIDVIRAFTSTAAAFAAGAAAVHCVESLERARRLAVELGGVPLMGEEHGRQPAGFDFGNSPGRIAAADLRGLEVVQRTSNGTRGLAAASGTSLLAASAANASATAAHIRRGGATTLRLVCTSEAPSEDRWCARYICGLLGSEPISATALSDAVLAAGREHVAPWSSVEDRSRAADFLDDVRACAEVDRYDFVMVGSRSPGSDVVTLRRVPVDGRAADA
jgi:2-phosphosulfolactate phosphatase